MSAQNAHRFTRIAVRIGAKNPLLRVVYPEIRNGKVIGVVPGFGNEFNLTASMMAITAGQQTSDASRGEGQNGSLYSIKVKDVTRKPETLIELFKRNPWNSEHSIAFVEALTK